MRRRHLPLLLIAGWFSRCASPPLELFSLAAIPGTPVATGPRRIELRRIGLAAYLDRPEIVRAVVNYRLLVTDRDRWGEPPVRMLERVLLENLVQRLPDAAVFAESGAISTRPDTILEIDIQRLDPDAAGVVVLLAQVAIRHDGALVPATARTVRLTAVPAVADTAGLVGAMSAVLAGLGDVLAGALVNG